jgi:hypothetical protein
VRITVTPEFQEELHHYDLPRLQPYVSRFDFAKVRRILRQFEEIQKRVREIEEDDEEVMLMTWN